MERELTLRSLSPLVLHANRSRTQFTPGLDYITGSAVRGAAAARYLQVLGDDDEFKALFVEERASFPDLVPSTDKMPGRLLPATARLCKRHSWKHAESLTDALLRLALAEMTGNLKSLKDQTWECCPELECRKVKNKRDRVQHGYVTPDYKRVLIEKKLLTGTSINRATGTAESGLLFSQEAVQEGQYFRGVVRINSNKVDELQTRLESVLQPGTQLRLGAARSRGLGLVEVIGWSDPWSTLDLESRVMSFNKAVRELSRYYEGGSDGTTYIALTLEGHVILRDKAKLPVPNLQDQSDLSELLGLNGVTLGRHVILPAEVRGWDALRGLPKHDEPALGRGSVFFFRVEPGSEASVQERLSTIESEGLGRRRSEGFGRVRVCDPFHYDFVLQEMEELEQ
jgi:CRISPR-associated protein Csx10